jgi:hypothetical protein
MDRGRAEAHLRLLAEAELRRATAPGARSLGHSGRLSLVAQALIAVGAVDVGTADEIQAELDLALAVRQPGDEGAAPRRLAWVRGRRDVTATFGGSRPASWRVVPVGQVIRIRDDEIRGDLGLLAYLQTAHGGRFTMAGWMHGAPPEPGTSRPRLPVSRHFIAADDKGAGYTLGFSSKITGAAALAGVLDLRPDPQHEIRWLELRTAPGEPAMRIHLDPRVQAPDITVTNTAASPGELLADVIAARVLTLASTSRRKRPGSWRPANQGYCRMSPAGSVMSLPHWRRPAPGPRPAVLGLHHSERGTILYLHAGGVTMEDDWEYYRGVRPLPALWIRDSADRWHATSDYAPRPLGDNGEVTLELEIAPPLEAGTQWIDVVAAGQSAQVRARLPVRWTWNP